LKISEKAFSLVELVIVIIILASLAVIAIPKFIDLSYQAIVRSEQRVMLEMLGAIQADHAKTFAQTGVDQWYQGDPFDLLTTGMPAGWHLLRYTPTWAEGDIIYILCPHASSDSADNPGDGAVFLYRRSKTTPTYGPEVEPGQVWLYRDYHGKRRHPDYIPVDKWNP